MKGYGLRAQEPSRETQISRESFELILHTTRYWSPEEQTPPIFSPFGPIAAQESARHVFIGSCKQAPPRLFSRASKLHRQGARLPFSEWYCSLGLDPQPQNYFNI